MIFNLKFCGIPRKYIFFANITMVAYCHLIGQFKGKETSAPDSTVRYWHVLKILGAHQCAAGHQLKIAGLNYKISEPLDQKS